MDCASGPDEWHSHLIDGPAAVLGGWKVKRCFDNLAEIVPFYTGALDNTWTSFSPVSYLRDEQLAGVLANVKANVRGNIPFLKTLTPEELESWVFLMMFAGVACLKHDGFHEECEWRLVYCPKVLGAQAMIEPEVKVIGGVPQHVQKFPLDGSVAPRMADLDLRTILDGVIIRPSSRTQARYVLRLPPVAFVTAAMIFCEIASISASVSVRSRGCSRTAMASDFFPSGTPLPS